MPPHGCHHGRLPNVCYLFVSVGRYADRRGVNADADTDTDTDTGRTQASRADRVGRQPASAGGKRLDNAVDCVLGRHRVYGHPNGIRRGH